MNMLFKKNDGRNIKKYDIHINKAMIFTDNVYQTNETLFVTVQPKKCKLELADHL